MYNLRITGLFTLKKTASRITVSLILFNIICISFLIIPKGYSASEEIESKFGDAPKIDGIINISTNEWNQAKKLQVTLNDLPIKLWVMNDEENLYLSVQLDLLPAAHNYSEFVGIMISNSSSENLEDFIDARIVQFINISENEFEYFDYSINNSIFKNDTINTGNGAARLEDISSTYEFSIPLNDINLDDEDASVEHGKSSAFMIVYGVSPYYPSGIRKNITVLVNIASLSTITPLFINSTLFILVIIIFITLGALYGFYVYKIFTLKNKIERIKH